MEKFVKCRKCGYAYDEWDWGEKRIVLLFDKNGEVTEFYEDAEECMCAECFAEYAQARDVVEYSKTQEKLNWWDRQIADDNYLQYEAGVKFSQSVISFMYSMDDLLELARKDINARLDIGYAPDVEKINRAARQYAGNRAVGYAEWKGLVR